MNRYKNLETESYIDRLFKALIDLKGPEDGSLKDGSLEENIYIFKVFLLLATIIGSPFAIGLLISLV